MLALQGAAPAYPVARGGGREPQACASVRPIFAALAIEGPTIRIGRDAESQGGGNCEPTASTRAIAKRTATAVRSTAIHIVESSPNRTMSHCDFRTLIEKHQVPVQSGTTSVAFVLRR